MRSGGDRHSQCHQPIDAAFAGIRRHKRYGVVELPRRRLKIGDRVQIVSGGLSGRFGLYAGMASHEHGGVPLQLLGAQGLVRLNRDVVEPVSVASYSSSMAMPR